MRSGKENGAGGSGARGYMEGRGMQDEVEVQEEMWKGGMRKNRTDHTTMLHKRALSSNMKSTQEKNILNLLPWFISVQVPL
jgi:hypothetical protein